MTTQDILGLGISYLYATTLLAIAELLRRFLHVPATITRKIIHVSAGMWVFGILVLFNTWQIGVIPFASFIGINYLLYRYRIIQAMDSSDSSPGTVYFAISITLLFILFWRPQTPEDQVVMAIAGTMAMTWGDASAALIGQNFGKHQYQFGSSIRSWEGSLTMFLVSAIAIFLVLIWLPGSFFSPLTQPLPLIKSFIIAVVAAVVATLVEAVSPHGTDNLSVPLTTAGIVTILNFGF